MNRGSRIRIGLLLALGLLVGGDEVAANRASEAAIGDPLATSIQDPVETPPPDEERPEGPSTGESEETPTLEEAVPELSDLSPGPAVIGEIVIDGNRRVSDSAFFNSLTIQSGDPYDEAVVRTEFRRLWKLNLFDDISVESRRRGSNTYDLIFHVVDRPLLGSVSFVGMKAVNETGIQERLSQSDVDVRRGQPVDYSTLRQAEATIQHLLAEKGYLEAQVRARLTPDAQGRQAVTFHIREGGKTKIKKIEFTGNTVFSDRKLRKTLKLTKEAFWLTSWASSKPLYHPAKFDQDVEGIRELYKSQGYLDVVIQPEVVELESEVKRRERLEKAAAKGIDLSGELPPALEDEEDDFWDELMEEPPPPPGETEKERKKRLKAQQKAEKKSTKRPKKWVYLTVPVDEGKQYRLGRVSVEGNTVFSDAEILARLPLRSGTIFNDSAVKFATKRIEDDYGARGYFYVSLDPRIERNGDFADLRLEVTEDKKYFVDRIEFSGNTTTRDSVLRREMRLHEEDLFNVRLLRLGIRKIAQLGYWQVGSEPVVKPRTEEAKVDVEVRGVEANRNEIQVGGGVSGIDGGFFQASYATRNFLGRGEILSTFMQIGARADRYSLNFTEPYFLGKPWTLGFSIFRRQSDSVGFRQIGTGTSVVLGRILGNFSRFDVAYGFEQIDFEPTDAGLGPASQTQTSSVTTLYTFDTRNNFFHPTRGTRLTTSFEYAGGSLGGDNNFIKIRQDATLYLRGLARRHYIGLNASYGYVEPFGGVRVPTFERFFLGGERSLRVFRTREVSPARRDLDLNGNGLIDFPEDRNPDGIFQPCEDLNGNGVQDENEIDRGNCILDPSEDLNGNLVLDTEDLNGNGILDPGEDANGNGVLDFEDVNGNGFLDLAEDRPDGVWTAFCPTDDVNMNGIRDGSEQDNGNCVLDPGEDTNGDGVFGTVFPGGDQYLLLNAEYTIPLTDTVEMAFFYDAGNAFDDDESVSLDDLRVDYGLEMRFYLPVFQAPLRLIYGLIQDPLPGEDSSNFIFSIGTTF